MVNRETESDERSATILLPCITGAQVAVAAKLAELQEEL